MNLFKTTLLAAVVAAFALSSCQQEEIVQKKDEVSAETLTRIHQLGFDTAGVQKVAGGYLVEGDILLSDEQLHGPQETKLLRVGKTEQYRTINLVENLPRTITVSIAKNLPNAYAQALDMALQRYNEQGLQLVFRRTTSRADIGITKLPGNANYIASAGFPSDGNPYNNISLNANYIGHNPNPEYLATILAHEIGHCIGFRHTDYMDRSFSCGGAVANEGASTVGAIEIPGTPVLQDPDSWMLACIGYGQSRSFNLNDITALHYLY